MGQGGYDVRAGLLVQPELPAEQDLSQGQSNGDTARDGEAKAGTPASSLRLHSL
jgi:hypothetical protein